MYISSSLISTFWLLASSIILARSVSSSIWFPSYWKNTSFFKAFLAVVFLVVLLTAGFVSASFLTGSFFAVSFLAVVFLVVFFAAGLAAFSAAGFLPLFLAGAASAFASVTTAFASSTTALASSFFSAISALTSFIFAATSSFFSSTASFTVFFSADLVAAGFFAAGLPVSLTSVSAVLSVVNALPNISFVSTF